MKNFLLLTLFTSTCILATHCAEDIDIDVATSSPNNTSSTISPVAEKSRDLEGTGKFINAVENYLTEATNAKQNEPQSQLQGYIGQPMYPVYPAPYNGGGYFYPGVNPNAVVQSNNYFSAVLPAAQMGFEIIRNLFLYYLVRYFTLKLIKIFDLLLDIREVLVTDDISYLVTKAALQAGLKLFAKLGLFLMGGAGLLAIGGVVCYLTPICTITFNGYDFQKALNKETMRSLMTPEKIASAAALVQDAIGKYQRLQRAVGQQ